MSDVDRHGPSGCMVSAANGLHAAYRMQHAGIVPTSPTTVKPNQDSLTLDRVVKSPYVFLLHGKEKRRFPFPHKSMTYITGH